MNAPHWATQYIGLPWQFGATGPEAYDCWGFTRHVQRKHFGVDMPHVDYAPNWKDTAEKLNNHEERRNWNPVVTAAEGDVVTMARARLPVHIGVWIIANRKPGVLHCLEGMGVLFQPATTLASSGWGKLQFYRHKA